MRLQLVSIFVVSASAAHWGVGAPPSNQCLWLVCAVCVCAMSAIVFVLCQWASELIYLQHALSLWEAAMEQQFVADTVHK